MVVFSQSSSNSVGVYQSKNPGTDFGQAVSGVGDVDGNGYPDLLIAAPNANVKARTMEAGDLADNRTLSASTRGEGDDDDGHGEGEGSKRPTSVVGAGACYLALSSGTLNGASTVTIIGEQACFSLAKAGDINRDGYEDFIIGAPKASPGGKRHAGKSYVIFGKASFPSQVYLSRLSGSDGFVIRGVRSGDESGTSVSGVGDINKDGFADVVIGAPFASPNGLMSAGEVYVVFGQAVFPKQVSLADLNGKNGFVLQGQSRFELFGRAVSGIGRVNGDTYPDIVIGALLANGYAGKSYVAFGMATFPRVWPSAWFDGQKGFVINGARPGDLFGGSVSGLGDMNGDGLDDFVVGAHLASPNQAGAAYVIFGQQSFPNKLSLAALDGTHTGFRIPGEHARDFLGRDVSAAGDVNGDGVADLLVGADGASGPAGKKAGKVYVVFGHRGAFPNPFLLASLNGANGFQISGARASDGIGSAVSGAGDVNGDGYGDVAVGVADTTAREAGAVYVVSGAPQ